MLTQSLLLIATMVIVGGALLASTLVSAKGAFHQAIIQKTNMAMSDATEQFVSWAQARVAKNGTETPWPSGVQPQSGPLFENLCTGQISGSAQKSSSLSSPSTTLPPGINAPGDSCSLVGTLEWTITGSSFQAATSLASHTSQASTAQHLAVSVDEQRVSATITVTVADPSGNKVFAKHSRELTARTFDALPHVVVTGTRDVSSEVGDIRTSEGDTGGARSGGAPLLTFSPSASQPASFTDTEITTTIDCANTADNKNPRDPLLDRENVNFDSSVRPYGNLKWIYEMPCVPGYAINAVGAPSDYKAPQGNKYWTNASINEEWRKGDENRSAYSQ